MGGGWTVTPNCFVTVFLLQILEACSYNLEHVGFPKITEFQVETITSQSTNSRIHLMYSPNEPDDPTVIDDSASLDTWSVIWYVASFGGLILFFLIVSCSEWCCRRNARRNCQRSSNIPTASQVIPDTPPPSYDQFAPPAYEDLWAGSGGSSRSEKTEYDIYVVPVHALGTIMEGARREEAPPSYLTASSVLADSSQLPRVHSNATTSVT